MENQESTTFNMWVMDTARKHNKRLLDRKELFASYWHQIDEVNRLKPDNILEVGIGNGFVSGYLGRLGYNVTTVDLVKVFKPTVISSILTLPFRSETFDVCLCCEVLEHLPFERFNLALGEFYRVGKKLIISLPDRTPWIGIKTVCKWSTIPEIILSLPNLFPKQHIFDGQHYWEIGKKDLC